MKQKPYKASTKQTKVAKTTICQQAKVVHRNLLVVEIYNNGQSLSYNSGKVIQKNQLAMMPEEYNEGFCYFLMLLPAMVDP